MFLHALSAATIATAVSYLLGKFDEREAEFLGVAKATDVTVERCEQLSLGVTWQDALQTAQFLGTERVTVASSHDLNELRVRLETELTQENVDVQAASTVQQVDLNTTRNSSR